MYTYQNAIAYIKGGADAPSISGTVEFYGQSEGVLIVARISGLPQDNPTGFFAFHIHEGTTCMGVHFAASGGHFNPESVPHPRHAGDLPPLLSADGAAYMSVLTNRFTVSDIIGKTIIIHSRADDFTTQPSGNAATKIACGIIVNRS